MKKMILSCFVVVSLSGCFGPTYEEGWVKPDTSRAESQRTLIACKKTATQTAERETLIGGLTESCMTLQGYKWRKY